MLAMEQLQPISGFLFIQIPLELTSLIPSDIERTLPGKALISSIKFGGIKT
jgi:hypothetical protein